MSMKYRLFSFLVKIRLFLLGFGLSGLHVDDFIPNLIFTILAAVGILLVVFEDSNHE